VLAVPRLGKFYPGICLTTEEKARKNLSQGKKNLSQVKKNLSQSSVYILPKTPTHYKTLTNTHITKPTHTHTCARTHTHTTKQYKTTTVQIKTKCIQEKKHNGEKELVTNFIHKIEKPNQKPND
jgi:hypothetical protein